MSYRIASFEIAEVRLLASIFVKIEDAKNRTFSVVIQVYNIVETTISILVKFLGLDMPTCASL